MSFVDLTEAEKEAGVAFADARYDQAIAKTANREAKRSSLPKLTPEFLLDNLRETDRLLTLHVVPAKLPQR